MEKPDGTPQAQTPVTEKILIVFDPKAAGQNLAYQLENLQPLKAIGLMEMVKLKLLEGIKKAPLVTPADVVGRGGLRRVQ